MSPEGTLSVASISWIQCLWHKSPIFNLQALVFFRLAKVWTSVYQSSGQLAGAKYQHWMKMLTKANIKVHVCKVFLFVHICTVFQIYLWIQYKKCTLHRLYYECNCVVELVVSFWLTSHFLLISGLKGDFEAWKKRFMTSLYRSEPMPVKERRGSCGGLCSCDSGVAGSCQDTQPVNIICVN